jgi:hypothetical protein
LVRGDKGGGEEATTLWVRTGGGRDCAMQDINQFLSINSFSKN